ncbi:MAG: hypothetical protein AB1480_05215 [Nitrospirota bacterium]
MSLAIAKKLTSDNTYKKKHDVAHGVFKNSHAYPQTPIIQLKPICPCDGGCPRCTPIIQPKLTIGRANDIYEQEADRVAEQVMRIPEPEVQPKPT